MQDPNEIEIPSLGDGACVDYPEPDLFTPEFKQHPNSPRSRLAKLICNACIVKDLCLEEALEHPNDTTIRAGLMPSEIRKLKGLRR